MKPTNTLTYSLTEGFIHDWLVAGPQQAEIDTLPTPPPAQPLHLEPITPDAPEVRWEYYRCGEDHLIHSGAPTSMPGRSRVWAYAQVRVPTATMTNGVLAANGAAWLWQNETLVHRQPTPDHSPRLRRGEPFALSLETGLNRILICVEIPTGPVRLALALPTRAPKHEDGKKATEFQVTLPTPIHHAARFQAFVSLFEQAYMDRADFYGDEAIALHWPQEPSQTYPIALRLQAPSGRIFAETLGQAQPGATTNLVSAVTLIPGAYEAVLMPRLEEYAAEQVRVRRSFPIHTFDSKPATTPQTGYFERLAAALRLLIRERHGLPTVMAAMALGAWGQINHDTLRASLSRSQEQGADNLRNLIGLYSLMAHYSDNPSFPAELRREIGAYLRTVRIPEGPRNGNGVAPHSGNRRQCDEVLLCTAQILAGQFAPTQPIGMSGRTGSEVRRQGETSALAWLRARGRGGFQFCLDESQLDDLIFGLNQLVTLAKHDTVAELAAVVLDKLFFTLALTTHQGIGPGGPAGAATHAAYLLWGTGIASPHPWLTLGLADSHYTLPDFIAQIARAPEPEEWSRQHHRGLEGSWAAHWATYRTPDYLLSALQDYRSGKHGEREQVWCAVLGDRARVFTTHPGHCGPDAGDGPSFWQGNRVLPRVAQWRDVLIAIYRLPVDDWLGFTHAHFPLYAFDEHAFAGDWAFARRGDAYLALTASTPFTLVETGPGAYRELRAPGHNTVWLCQMGRTALDHSFANFQTRVKNSPLQFTSESVGGDLFSRVAYTDIRGNDLQLGWDGPLLCNGNPQPITSPNHYDTPYSVTHNPAQPMEIRVGDTIVHLDFS